MTGGRFVTSCTPTGAVTEAKANDKKVTQKSTSPNPVRHKHPVNSDLRHSASGPSIDVLILNWVIQPDNANNERRK